MPAFAAAEPIASGANEALADPRLASFVDALLPVGAAATAAKLKAACLRTLSSLLAAESARAQALRAGYVIFALSWTPALRRNGEAGAEALLSRLLEGAHAAKIEAALDIAYDEIAELAGIDEVTWGHSYSRRGEACLYWDRYDKAPP